MPYIDHPLQVDYKQSQYDSSQIYNNESANVAVAAVASFGNAKLRHSTVNITVIILLSSLRCIISDNDEPTSKTTTTTTTRFAKSSENKNDDQ